MTLRNLKLADLQTCYAPTKLAMRNVEFRFRTPLKASARVAWADTLRAMRENSYEAKAGRRYHILFVCHTNAVTMAQLPSCMNEAISGIADALEADRLALLVGYQWGDVDGSGVEVVVEEVQP